MVDKNGFTPGEKKVHDKLMEAYGAFLEIPRQHPDELREFGDAIHLLQNLMAVRVVRRDYPEGWPTYPNGEV